MRVPNVITVDLTAQCNLRCRYCGFFADHAASGNADLETEEWLQLIAEAGREGVFEFRFRGGEALTRSDFPELLEAVVANRMRFQLQTNALNFNDELARQIQRSGRCNLIRVSLDGEAPVHDAARGAGTHERVLEAIGRLRRYGLPFRITAAVHRANVAQLPQTAEYLLRQLQLPAVGFSGVVDGAPEEFILRSEDWVSAFEVLGTIERSYAAQLNSAGMIGVLRNWRQIRDRKPPTRCFGACPRSQSALSVRNDGSYMLCANMASTPLGRINVDSLGEVWRESVRLTQLRHDGDRPENWPECRKCEWKVYCAGGCPASQCSGDGGKPVRHCFKTFLDYGGSAEKI